MDRRIKVLIVDDSALVRQTLSDVVATDSELVVIGTASDPYVAAKRIAEQAPDVITLDVEMPRMDGITFLRKLMSQHPIPVVMCSSLTEKGRDLTLQALQLGAVDVITKPQIGLKSFFETSCSGICDTLKAAARARISRRQFEEPAPEQRLSADAILPRYKNSSRIQTTENVIVMGASTGGTEALRHILTALPVDSPGIVVVQHMPEHFTAQFAKHLDRECRVTVKEAEDGDNVIRGRVLIAPGNKHVVMERSGARYYVAVVDGPPVNRHRPSVDVLFRSAAQVAGPNAVAVILSGMGDDGARGMHEMRLSGSHTIAQDENTCVVYGMPKEAVALGGVEHVLPVSDIAQAMIRLGGS